jgi:hypothetical protein
LFLFQDRTITAYEPVILEFKIISLCRLETTRHVSMITITLSKKELDTSSIGYAYCTLLSTAFNDFASLSLPISMVSYAMNSHLAASSNLIRNQYSLCFFL